MTVADLPASIHLKEGVGSELEVLEEVLWCAPLLDVVVGKSGDAFHCFSPCVLPQRITPALCEMIKKYHPIYVNTHFNHPWECTPEAKQAYAMKKAAEVQAARIRNDQSLTSGQRDTALAGIRQETEKSIHAVLGEKGWEQFNRGANNHWLDLIKPRSAAQPAAVPPP